MGGLFHLLRGSWAWVVVLPGQHLAARRKNLKLLVPPSWKPHIVSPVVPVFLFFKEKHSFWGFKPSGSPRSQFENYWPRSSGGVRSEVSGCAGAPDIHPPCSVPVTWTLQDSSWGRLHSRGQAGPGTGLCFLFSGAQGQRPTGVSGPWCQALEFALALGPLKAGVGVLGSYLISGESWDDRLAAPNPHSRPEGWSLPPFWTSHPSCPPRKHPSPWAFVDLDTNG